MAPVAKQVQLAAIALALAAGGCLQLAAAHGPARYVFAAAGVAGVVIEIVAVLQSLRRGRLGIDAVALLALVGALTVGEDLAAAVIALMVASGMSLEAWAEGRARAELTALLARAPRTARRYRNGELETVDVAAVQPGETVMVAAGEVVPVDGNLAAAAVLDESALSGESMLVARGAGDPVRSGVLNAGPPFDVIASASAADSAYAGIVKLVAEAESEPAPFVRLADRFAVGFLLVSVGGAAAAWAVGGAGRAVAVLVVATPCPLILAAPVAMVAGLSRSARRGVVVKNAAVLERLGRCTTVLADKTGTLTTGQPRLRDVATTDGLAVADVLRAAASLEQLSSHVLARALVHAARERRLELTLPDGVEEVAGRGLRGSVGGLTVAVGNADWAGAHPTPLWARAALRRARLDGSLTVYVALGGAPAAVLSLEDPVRRDAASTIRSLRRHGITRVVVLTGDRPEVAEAVGAVVGADEVLAEQTPQDKLDVVRAERRRAPTIMVGDGINDAPALALADVGVAMGARGSSASSEAADVVLSVDRLDRLGEARSIARRSRRVALESVVAGMAMSLAAMAVAGFGLLAPVWGAMLQEAIDLAVILNALRALRLPGADVRLAGQAAELSRRFDEEHKAIRVDIDEIRDVADALGSLTPREAGVRLEALHRLLVDEVVPHERAEDELLYPALDRFLGGRDATGPMSRAHLEIAHRVSRLGQLLEEIGPGGSDDEDSDDLRRLLYGLHAVLELHTAQEDEYYLSLGEHDLDGEPAGNDVAHGSSVGGAGGSATPAAR